MTQHQGRLLLLLFMALTAGADVARGESFDFGGSQNGFDGMPSTTLTAGDFHLQLTAGIPGSLLNEPQSNGMGIDSRPVAGTGDAAPALFSIIGGAGPLAGANEWLEFSFDRPGVITGIDFDGVKDESLEYFILESTGGLHVNYFDSTANITVPGAVDDAIAAGAVTGTVFYLLEIQNGPDDEAKGLAIPFAAGQQFSLTFGSLGAQFGALQVANGARLQGIIIEAVPEPASIVLLALVALVCYGHRGASGLKAGGCKAFANYGHNDVASRSSTNFERT